MDKTLESEICEGNAQEQAAFRVARDAIVSAWDNPTVLGVVALGIASANLNTPLLLVRVGETLNVDPKEVARRMTVCLLHEIEAEMDAAWIDPEPDEDEDTIENQANVRDTAFASARDDSLRDFGPSF